MKKHKSIAQICQEKFGMSESEYLTEKINKGWTTRMIGDELGVSFVSVRDRLMLMADYVPGRWVARRRAA